MAGFVGAGDLDRCRTNVVCERGRTGEPASASGPPDETACGDSAVTNVLGKVLPEAATRSLICWALDLRRASTERIWVIRPAAICLRTRSTSPAGRTLRSSAAAVLADRSRGAPPASSSRSSAWSWFTSRTRLCARFIRDSSSKAKASVMPSGSSGRLSPHSAATLAAAAASIWSFLRPPPRESCRTLPLTGKRHSGAATETVALSPAWRWTVRALRGQ